MKRTDRSACRCAAHIDLPFTGFGYESRWSLRVDLASICIIETYPEINMLCLLNDVSHLMAERNS